jgi:hypothetical protein
MTRVQLALIAAVCLAASAAGAQERTPKVTLVPATSTTRWDVATQITWLGERRPAESFEWDRWFNVASGGGSIGYYWTTHLKSEVDLFTSSEGETYSVEFISVPGLTSPLYIERDHKVRFTTLSVGLTGQFFENAWFHPFVSGGLELVREREHVHTPPPIPPRGTSVGLAAEESTRVRYSERPYLATGFKVYLSEHAFIRSDIRTSWSSQGLAALGWRSGVGVDF